MIRAFDDYGLKELNNRLTKYEKIIQKLSYQAEISNAQASVFEDEIPVSMLNEDIDETETEEPEEETPVEDMTPKERRAAKKAAKKAKRKAKKQERKERKEEKKRLREDESKTVSIMNGSDTGYSSVKVPESKAVGFMQPGGRIDLYDTNKSESIVMNVAATSKIGTGTLARIAVPSSYYLDLRGIWLSTATMQYTADVLVVHDSSGYTITLTGVDETNNVGTAGPIAGGRDQAGAFSASSWIHFYVIYNPTTGDVSSISSASSTAPTLPTGYTYYVRVGTVRFNSISQLTVCYQMNDKVTYNLQWPKWDTHATGTESIDISVYVPDTAKLVQGVIGLSSGTSPKLMAVSANSGATIKVGSLCDAQGTGSTSYGVSGSKDFELPMLTAHTIWWITESTGDIYALGISGFTDDL